MVLENLEPRIVWQIFEEVVCSTPRPSGFEEKIRMKIKSWLVEQMEKKGIELTILEDKVGNIFVKKPASNGMEQRPSILLQAHMDMVCETDKPEGFDFKNLGIPVRIQENNKWVDADGTTLGADNGMGVSLALATLVDTNNLHQHGPIEVLLTVNEEAGFTGAFGLDVETFNINSKYMINLDSGPLGGITVGSVGGRRTRLLKKFELLDEATEKKLRFILLSVDGLLGGHSGVDIHLPRANANKIISRIMSNLIQKHEINLCWWNGGTRANVLPRKSSIKFAFSASEVPQIIDLIKAEISEIYQFYRNDQKGSNVLEPHLNILWKIDDLEQYLSYNDTKIVFATANNIPHGVLKQSPVFQGLVGLSNNFAIIDTGNKKVIIWIHTRSISRPDLDYFTNRITQLAELGDWKVKLLPVLPEWIPDPVSIFLEFVKTEYKTLLKNSVSSFVIHAGLEAGVISKKIPGLQVIALGPTVIGEHSPTERIRIADVGKVYQLLLNVINNMPQSQLI